MDTQSIAEIEAFALSKGFEEPAALKAVAFTESAGVFFWIVNNEHVPAYRHEGHYFHRLLKKYRPHLLARAVAEGLAHPTAGVVKNPSNWTERYRLYERCAAIDEGIAIRSASWGVGQVMGEWWDDLGYSSPQELKDSCFSGVEGQMELMWRYIVKYGLLDEIERLDWAGFAKGYNGPSYKRNAYDTKMAKAYAMFKKSPDKGHVYIVQQKLAKLGLYSGKVDGIFGPKTDAAVRIFQTKAGIVVDGQVGSVTIEQIDAYNEAKSSVKTRSKIPAVAGGAALLSGGIPKVMDAVTQAQDFAYQSRSLMEAINLPSLAVTIVVAAVVVVVLGALLRKVKSDDIASDMQS